MTRTLLALFLLGSLGAFADEPLHVVTTIETFADLARRASAATRWR